MDRSEPPVPPISVMSIVRLALGVWWLDFAPITLLGFVFLLMPALGGRLMGSVVPEAEMVGATAQGVCAMLFACASGYGVLHRFARRPLSPRIFIIKGLMAVQPGLVVALILGAAIVTVRIFFVIAGMTGVDPLAAASLRASGTVAAVVGLAVLIPAVPAALAERLGPIGALERAAALTRGSRLRLLWLCAVLALCLTSAFGILSMVLFAPQAGLDDMPPVVRAMGVADPGLWILLVSEVMIAGVFACVPSAVYATLVARAATVEERGG